MPKKNDVYKCNICGAMHQIIHDGSCEPSCCGKQMTRLKDNFVEASTEKHIPVIAKIEGGIRVVVGEVEHPMEESHFIEWIEVRYGNTVIRTFLSPGDAPSAEFNIGDVEAEVRAYCNLHGLWKA